MIASPSCLLELAADCDAKRVRLVAGRDGSLTIDSPRGALTPELLNRLKAHKTEILALLLRAQDVDVARAPGAEPTHIIDLPKNVKPICRCGSTISRDVPIHEGQSVRRDCRRCGRFIEFPVW